MKTTPHIDNIEKRQEPQSNIQAYLKEKLALKHADLPIIACCLVSGLCDSSVYEAWNCFVSMQTGNTIFLALGASNQPINRPYGWLRSLTSIVFFMCGCLFFAQTRRIGPRLRRTLVASFTIQALCIFIAATLVQSDVVPGHPVEGGSVHFIELLPLAFLAFQSGGQIITSRLLGFNEVPTTVLTSVYCDLVSDENLMAPLKENIKRNRRMAAVVSLLIGAIAGGWLTRTGPGMVLALWISGAVKVGIVVAWLLWPVAEDSPA